MNNIPDSASRDLTSFLTIGRTIMANERTLLAFLRTSLAFGAAGISLIKFMEHPLLNATGWIFVLFAAVLLVWGLYRHRHVKKILGQVTPKDLQKAEKEIGL